MFQFESYHQLNTPSQYRYIESYLSIFERVLHQQLACNKRITCIRLDLRFPKVSNYQDPKVISRFIDALKARLNVWKSQHAVQGKQHHRLGFSYVWVRERHNSHNWHYHLVLFFNKDAFAYLGILDLNRDNMRSRLVEAWSSATGMIDIEVKSLVHISNKDIKYLDSNSAEFYEQLNRLWQQLTYLAKVVTKDVNDGNRNIGYSRKVFY
ncbi:inovirus Gp2 family protein [Shewanella marinintestina]|uniref:inovirus Gp2 family protein n=1 Tax=Shewanella marinintestina TaxID=190305 RepID=UPI00200E5F36|nr:inovirus Gp2 family protein [Shewanella marinintestina]MCL1145388.1 inovirus Gp2 family protein [Shewanella marinintestina]